MKISVNRDAITLAEKDDARKMASENAWIDAETVKFAVTKNLRAFHGDESIVVDSLLSVGKAEISKNHYRMCVWIDDAVAEYTTFDGKLHCHMAKVSFDMTDYLEEGKPCAFIRSYEENDVRCC